MKLQFQQFLKGLTIFGALYSLFENYLFTKEKQTSKSKYHIKPHIRIVPTLISTLHKEGFRCFEGGSVDPHLELSK